MAGIDDSGAIRNYVLVQADQETFGNVVGVDRQVDFAQADGNRPVDADISGYVHRAAIVEHELRCEADKGKASCNRTRIENVDRGRRGGRERAGHSYTRFGQRRTGGINQVIGGDRAGVLEAERLVDIAGNKRTHRS